VFSYEYVRNPESEWPPNENDEKYLAYSELLLQALEYGAGYRVEWEDTLYIVPTPIVRIDSQNRFHSDDIPAIQWKGGWKGHYLYGEYFEKKLWSRITSGNFTAKELMEIEDSDQRSIAMTYLVPSDMLEQLNAKLLHTGVRGNKLYECKDYLGSDKTEFALWMKDASTPREFISFVPKDFDHHNNADEATAGMFRTGDGRSMPLEDYLNLSVEA
jgi:hypothetical protein